MLAWQCTEVSESPKLESFRERVTYTWKYVAITLTSPDNDWQRTLDDQHLDFLVSILTFHVCVSCFASDRRRVFFALAHDFKNVHYVVFIWFHHVVFLWRVGAHKNIAKMLCPIGVLRFFFYVHLERVLADEHICWVRLSLFLQFFN